MLCLAIDLGKCTIIIVNAIFIYRKMSSRNCQNYANEIYLRMQLFRMYLDNVILNVNLVK